MTGGTALAAEIEKASADFADYAARLNQDEWRGTDVNNPAVVFGEPDVPGPAGQGVHHVAISFEPMLQILGAIAANRQPQRFTPEDLARAKAEQAVTTPNQAETVKLIRAKGIEAAQLVAGMTDEQLDRVTGVHGPATTEETIYRLLIGHLRWHLFSLRTAVGR